MTTGRERRPTRAQSVCLLAGVAALVALLSAGCENDPAAETGSQRATTVAGKQRPESWPDARSTGAHGPLEPSPIRTLDEDGAVLADVRVDGQLVIAGDNVTVRNVRVRTDGYFGVLVAGKNARIEDSTIEGRVGTEAGIAAYPGGQFVARRVNVFGFEDGVHVNSGSALLDSYVHDLVGAADAHFDGVTANNEVGWRIVHNTIINDHNQTAAVWVGDPRDVPSSGLLKDNYLAGGGYTIYAGPGGSPGIRVVGNTFSTRFFPRSGYWGTVAKWDPRGNVWQGNTWADGPHKGEVVTP